MKKFVFFICTGLTVLFISCSQPNAGKGISNTSDNEKSERERMIANNEKINRAFETGNFNGVDSFWADNIVNHSGSQGEVRGKDSVKAQLMEVCKTMKDIKIETKTSAWDAEKGYLFSLTRFTGTTLVAMEGMPANTKVDMSSVDVVKVVNGKATDHWSFDSPEDMMKMMAPQKK